MLSDIFLLAWVLLVNRIHRWIAKPIAERKAYGNQFCYCESYSLSNSRNVAHFFTISLQPQNSFVYMLCMLVQYRNPHIAIKSNMKARASLCAKCCWASMMILGCGSFAASVSAVRHASLSTSRQPEIDVGLIYMPIIGNFFHHWNERFRVPCANANQLSCAWVMSTKLFSMPDC